MADKNKIEIDIRAKGGKAAAKEVEEVVDQVEDLGDAAKEVDKPTGDLSARFAGARREAEKLKEALDKTSGQQGGGGARGMFPTFTAAGGAVKGLAGKLVGLAGGPLGIAAIAMTAITAKVVGFYRELQTLKAELDASASASAKVARAGRESGDAFSDSASGVREFSDALDEAATARDAALAAEESMRDALIRRREAEMDLRDAIRERKVAEGEMTQEQADAESTADQITLARKEAADAVEEASRRVITAQQNAAAAAEAEKIKAAELANAEEAAAKAQERIQRFRERAAETDALAGAVLDSNVGADGISGGSSGRQVRDAFNATTTESERDFIENRMDRSGESLEEVLKSPELIGYRKRIAEELQRQAALATRAAENEEGDAVQAAEAAEAKLKAEQAELAAILKRAEIAEAALAAAEAEQQAALGDQATTEELTIPAMEQREAARQAREAAKAEAARVAAEQKEQDRIAKEEAARAAQVGKEVDTQAGAIAGEISAKVAGAREGTGNDALVETLRGIAAALGDGTDSTELAAVQAQLASALSGAVGLQDQTRQELNATKARLADLEARLRNNQ